MSIFLIRHGETDSNAQRVIQTPETPLSECGHRQASLLANRLAEAGVSHILASDLPRAAMTAQALERATGASITYHAVLQERNFGDIRGLAYEEVGADIFADDYVPPGGESWEAFHQRVDLAWERVGEALSSHETNLAVVTHGLVCRGFVSRHCTLPAGLNEPDGWANTSLTVIDAAAPWQVQLLNCTTHLDADTGAGAPRGPTV